MNTTETGKQGAEAERAASGNRPGFYAVIPANVRYDPALSDGAKLLFAEITALCDREGFCTAADACFSSLLQKSGSDVGGWINALENRGYITVSFPETRGAGQRLISLSEEVQP